MSDDFDFELEEDQLDLTLYADAPELAEEVTSQILAQISTGLAERGRFDLVLTGGTLGIEIQNQLIDHFNEVSHEYQGLHIWFSDERFVEANSPERNALPFHVDLKNTNITVHEVLPSDQASSEESCANYLRAIEDVHFDLNILGIGPDGHVASIFPGVGDIDDQRKVFLITDSPKPPSIRVSFTMATINRADEVWIIAAGASKADAVTAIIEGDTSIPATYVTGARHTRLIVDTEAFFSE